MVFKSDSPGFISTQSFVSFVFIQPVQSLSRKHASIEVVPPNAFILTDLGSRNGTFINNVRLFHPFMNCIELSLRSFFRSELSPMANEDWLMEIESVWATPNSSSPPETLISIK